MKTIKADVCLYTKRTKYVAEKIKLKSEMSYPPRRGIEPRSPA